jgi:Histidine kinase-, DNA gyrase B-, and HSP90-like ATPase
MVGMRLGGIDPSILRELSGVYKPFVKAFKELVSNAFDADADVVHVVFADDFSSVTVADDGQGMTPFEFRNDFARIGGGSRRWAGDRTRKGRLRIGSKGIGFLALARYCDRLKVESGALRVFQSQVELPETPATFDVPSFLGVPIPRTCSRNDSLVRSGAPASVAVSWRGATISGTGRAHGCRSARMSAPSP